MAFIFDSLSKRCEPAVNRVKKLEHRRDDLNREIDDDIASRRTAKKKTVKQSKIDRLRRKRDDVNVELKHASRELERTIIAEIERAAPGLIPLEYHETSKAHIDNNGKFHVLIGYYDPVIRNDKVDYHGHLIIQPGSSKIYYRLIHEQHGNQNSFDLAELSTLTLS